VQKKKKGHPRGGPARAQGSNGVKTDRAHTDELRDKNKKGEEFGAVSDGPSLLPNNKRHAKAGRGVTVREDGQFLVERGRARKNSTHMQS